MTIGQKIKELRIKHSYTQEQLAQRLDVTPQSISKWENDYTMPDIALLPNLSSLFGVSIDELFDISVEQKFARIESKLDIDELIKESEYQDIENFLLEKIKFDEYKYEATYLLCYLYTRRHMDAEKMIKKYAMQGIKLDPQKKRMQWMIGRTGNYDCWDWDMCNHTEAINFYKEVLEENPNSSLTMCYLIDNLIADKRADEAEMFVARYKKLRPDNIALIAAYEAGIELARYNEEKADNIMLELERKYPNDEGCLFEIAQYFAKKAQYEKAIPYYEKSFNIDTNIPHYTDALLSIADIYDIMGNIEKEVETYDRIIKCCRDEWNLDEEIELKDYIDKRNTLAAKLKK